MAKFKPI